MLTRYDRFIVWLAFKVANRNARKWTIKQLRTRILELEEIPEPNQAHIALLTAYRLHNPWTAYSSYPFDEP